MHIRFSIACGTPVLDDDTSHAVGKIADILIHPDTAKIVGFFVAMPGVLGGQQLFLSSHDIVAWGTVVHVRSHDVLAPADDIVRLQSLLEDQRRVIGQPIVTRKKHRSLGVCKDVQFDTRLLTVEWLFPRKYLFLAQTPIPVSEVIEVTKKAIVVRDPLEPKKVKEEEPVGVPRLEEVLPVAPTPS